MRLMGPTRKNSRKMAPGVLKSRAMYEPRITILPYGAPQARHNDSTLPVKMARKVKAPGEVSGSVSTKKLALAYGAYIRYNMVTPAYPSEKAVLGQSIPQIRYR